MCRAEGMGIAPWGSLGGGKFKTEEQRNAQEGRRVEASEKEIQTSQVLESIANRKNSLITSIALAYVMHKTPYVFPIIGGRKVDHLKANIQALTLNLSQEDVEEIDGAVEFDPGFPNDFLYRGGHSIGGPDVWLLQMGGTFDHVQSSKVISAVRRSRSMSANYI
jgi:aryl-alcohol dehydrogenase-like predicted oxidoreductase